MSLRGSPSSAFYTHKARTSTIFVKKKRKNAFSYLSALSEAGSRRFLLKLFCISIIHPKKNYSKLHYFLMRSTTNSKKWFPFFEEVKYAVFRDSALQIFHFPLHKHIIGLQLKILLTIFLWVIHMPLTNPLTLLSNSLCAGVWI